MEYSNGNYITVDFADKCPILILGHAGQGKSLYLTKVAKDLLEDTSLVPIFIECKNIPNELNLSNNEGLTADDISKKLEEKYLRGISNDPVERLILLEYHVHRLVFLIDGYDELESANKTNGVLLEGLIRFTQKNQCGESSKDIFRRLLENAEGNNKNDKLDYVYKNISDNSRFKLILTSRFSDFILGEKSYFYRIYIEQSLTKEQIVNFIKSRITDTYKQSALFNFCIDSRNELLHNYLTLYLVVCLFNEDNNIAERNKLINGEYNSTQIYNKIINSMLVVYQAATRTTLSSRELNLQMEIKINHLAEMAYDMVFNGMKYKWRDIFDKFLSEEVINSINIIFKINVDEEYSFVHQTFKEYFCALKISKEIKDDIVKIQNYYTIHTDINAIKKHENLSSYFNNNLDNVHRFMSEMAQIDSNNSFIHSLRTNRGYDNFIKPSEIFYLSDGAPTVIHLNQPLLNYQAAITTIDFLQYISEVFSINFSINMFLVDGAAGPVDTRLIKSIPDKKIRKTVCDKLLEKGTLTVIEYYDIIFDNNIPIYGVEDKDIFIELTNLEKKKLEYINSNSINLEKLDNFTNEKVMSIADDIYTTEEMERIIELYVDRSFKIVENVKTIITEKSAKTALLLYSYNDGTLGRLDHSFFAINGLNYIKINLTGNFGIEWERYKQRKLGKYLP